MFILIGDKIEVRVTKGGIPVYILILLFSDLGIILCSSCLGLSDGECCKFKLDFLIKNNFLIQNYFSLLVQDLLFIIQKFKNLWKMFSLALHFGDKPDLN